MNKLLEDAKAAGFYVSDEGYIHNFDGLDKLNSKLAKFTTLQQPQWVSVKDRLPDDDNEFLVCVKDKFGNCEYSVAAYNKSLFI